MTVWLAKKRFKGEGAKYSRCGEKLPAKRLPNVPANKARIGTKITRKSSLILIDILKFSAKFNMILIQALVMLFINWRTVYWVVFRERVCSLTSIGG